MLGPTIRGLVDRVTVIRRLPETSRAEVIYSFLQSTDASAYCIRRWKSEELKLSIRNQMKLQHFVEFSLSVRT